MTTAFPTAQDIAAMQAFRRDLHRRPELSGEEALTAAAVSAMLAPTRPDRVIEGLGGHGLAAIYEGAAPGPTVLLRAELDALPIEEVGTPDWRSETRGKGHLCGHDGHMAILGAVAAALGRARPARGRAILLFQPAEETGAGAKAVIEDPRFEEIRPDLALSLHNFPGLPLGAVALAPGPMACASRGMRLRLSGRTAHASQPETGVSPGPALARLIPGLTALGAGGDPADPGFSLVTVTHARMGEPAFGVAPGAAEIWATLRTQRDAAMDALVKAAEALARQAAEDAGLALSITWHDVFLHCENAPEAVDILSRALAAENVPVSPAGLPMRASEDFGRFGAVAPAAMFLLGAGEDAPALHNPDYDFPDALIPTGARVFLRCLHERLS
ncbi:amidohydrolase [Rhodovulum sp. DZ06]|uniref:amidohydrolase n=1 Tax=Rhodovulum sp. DZ06 TaxID=3425126 RepID=UPI003D33F454